MRTKLVVSGWILLLSIPFFSSVWAGPGSDSIQLPSLKTDGEKLAFLIEIKQKIPKLFGDAAKYDIDLFSLLDDETQLLERLKSNPKYLHAFENKSYDEITVTPPPGGLEVGTRKIKREAIQQWKSQLNQTLQNVERGGPSPQKAVSSQINGIVESLEDSGDFSNLSGKKFGRLLAEFGREKQNQALFNEKIGKAKDLDLKGRLALALELYDQFPVKPHAVTKEHLERAIQSLSEVEKLISLSALQVVLHRPGQAEHADEIPWESWKAAEDSLNQLNGQDLEFFLDKQDALAPLVRSSISHQVPAMSALEPQLIEAIFEGIEFYAQQTEGELQRATEKIRLTQVPPAVGIFRGCTGGDCSSRYSFPYPNDPHERVFFIYDSEDQLKGYVSSTEVRVQGEPSLYIITISGNRVNAADTELVLRALERAKDQLGVKNILLPEPSKVAGLINFSEIRGVYEMYTQQKPLLPIQYQAPALRKIIERYENQLNSGQYDHMKNNRHGVVLKFSDQKSSQLSVQHERLSDTRILSKSLSEIQNSDIVEFLLDLNKSGRSEIVQKVTQIQEVRSKINLKHFIKLTDDLLKKCSEKAGSPLSVQTYRHQVQTLFSELGMDSNYLENHLALLYPGIVHCQDPYSDQNINLTANFIIKDIKETDRLYPQGINLSALKDSDKKAISQSAPFLKYYNQLSQQISDPSFKLSENVVRAFGALLRLGDLKIKDVAIIHTLTERLKDKDSDSKAREESARMLGILKPSNPAIAHALAEHLKDPDDSVRYEVMEALGEIKPSDPYFYHKLIEHLKDKDADSAVREEAVRALGILKPSDPTIAHALAEHLKDPDARVRYAVIDALGEIKPSDPAIAHALAEHLSNPNASVRYAVIDALGEIKPSDASIVCALVELLKTAPYPSSDAAGKALIKIRPSDPLALFALVELLRSENFYISTLAAKTLGEIKPNDLGVNQALAKLLKEKPIGIRIYAAYVLAKINPTDSVIHQALSDPEIYLALIETVQKNQPTHSKYFASNVLTQLEAEPTVRKAILGNLIFEFHKANTVKRTKILTAVQRLHNVDPTLLEDFSQEAKRTVEACKTSNHNLEECQSLEVLSDITHKLGHVR